MKKCMLALAIVASLAANANNEKDANHPCHKIKAACEAAGFKKGGAKEGKGLFQNCMKPVINGQAVAGVTVDARCRCLQNKKRTSSRVETMPVVSLNTTGIFFKLVSFY